MSDLNPSGDYQHKDSADLRADEQVDDEAAREAHETVVFATCERHRALQFLQQVHPSRTITADSVKNLLDLVAEDIVRIGDPFEVDRLAIWPGLRWDEAR